MEGIAEKPSDSFKSTGVKVHNLSLKSAAVLEDLSVTHALSIF